MFDYKALAATEPLGLALAIGPNGNIKRQHRCFSCAGHDCWMMAVAVFDISFCGSSVSSAAALCAVDDFWITPFKARIYSKA